MPEDSRRERILLSRFGPLDESSVGGEYGKLHLAFRPVENGVSTQAQSLAGHGFGGLSRNMNGLNFEEVASAYLSKWLIQSPELNGGCFGKLPKVLLGPIEKVASVTQNTDNICLADFSALC